MTIKCNAGITKTNMIGIMPGYPGEVWYNPKGIANILSMANVKKYFRVTYDSAGGEGFVVHKPDGTQRQFQESNTGLFYLDTSRQLTATVLVTTVDDIEANYTVRDYKHAGVARHLQNVIGRPSTRDFLNMVGSNLLPNCPITIKDIMTAEEIFGPNIGSLKGKTVRRKGDHVTTTRHCSVSIEILQRHQRVVLCIDLMFVNKVPFLMTISRDIKFGTAEMLHRRDAKYILKAIKNVKAIYNKQGFKITRIHTDNEFEILRADLIDDPVSPVELNTSSNAEHVPEIERYIRTVKEQARCVWNTMPFKKIPTRMVVELVHLSVFWLNTFPATDGILAAMSPRAIIVGLQVDHNKHCKIEFGAYAQTHDEYDNSMATRTTGAIALRPTGNDQGAYYFMSLTTGRRLNRHNWTPLFMPQDVIDRVHSLARRSYANQGLTFAWRTGKEIPSALNEIDDDSDGEHAYVYSSDDDDDDTQDDGATDDEIDPDPLDLPITGVPEEQGPMENLNDRQSGEDPEDNDNHSMNNATTISKDGAIKETESIAHDEESNQSMDNNKESNDEENQLKETTQMEDRSQVDNQLTIEQDMDAEYGARKHQLGLRPRCMPNYGQKEGHTSATKPSDYDRKHQNLQHTALTQYSSMKGLRVFGEAGAEAVVKEIEQLDERKVIEPKRANMLTRQEKKDALEYLMFLRKKRCGKIKGRGCADGRKQRIYKTKEETSAPTVAVESLFSSSVIDAEEG